jgi:hypothetical protein
LIDRAVPAVWGAGFADVHNIFSKEKKSALSGKRCPLLFN